MSDATRDLGTERAPGAEATPKAADSAAAARSGNTEPVAVAEPTGSAESTGGAGPDQDAGPARSVETPEKMVEEDRAPMAFTIRVFIYLVAVHFIVGFFFLIFYLAGARSH